MNLAAIALLLLPVQLPGKEFCQDAMSFYEMRIPQNYLFSILGCLCPLILISSKECVALRCVASVSIFSFLFLVLCIAMETLKECSNQRCIKSGLATKGNYQVHVRVPRFFSLTSCDVMSCPMQCGHILVPSVVHVNQWE